MGLRWGKGGGGVFNVEGNNNLVGLSFTVANLQKIFSYPTYLANDSPHVQNAKLALMPKNVIKCASEAAQN